MKQDTKLTLKELNTKMQLWVVEDFARGNLIWLPNGLKLINNLKKLVKPVLGYEISTPPLYKLSLWEKTGHLSYFKENMFLLDKVGLKPMSCPAHVLTLKSLKVNHLPFTVGEFGLVYRKEAYGAVNVPFRNLTFTQDDSHVFLEYKDLVFEILYFIKCVLVIYELLGFNQVNVTLELSPTCSPRLEKINKLMVLLYQRFLGSYEPSYEGAFYGPKFEMHLIDKSGKSWQCGTIQLDVELSRKLKFKVNNRFPLTLHRALLGSLERFLGLSLLNTKGYLPRVLHFDQAHLYLVNPEKTSFNFINNLSNVRIFKGIDKIRQGWTLAERNCVPVRVFHGDKEGDLFKVQQHSGVDVKISYLNKVDLIKFLGRLA